MFAPPENLPSLVGRVFGNQFRLESLLGRGGMGEVYCAEQLELGRRVVLKLLMYSQLWGTPELEERFRREARILAQLNHPNIVQLYSFGRSEDGISYLAMEYIEGRTLTSTINERGALPEPLVLHILDQICGALVEAHKHGIVHRDLKPDNVMTMERYGQPAFVKVLDFGIAKLTHTHDPRLTKSGAILGTPQYMAPEQLREQPIDGRTDIYALGLIGYELLTGEVPFEGDNTMDLMLRVITDEAIPPSRRATGAHISPATEALIVRCLAKEPEQRFQTSTELREALAAIPRAGDEAATRELAASPPPLAAFAEPSLRLSERDLTTEPTSDRGGRRLRTFAIGAAVLIAIAGMIGALGWLAVTDTAVPSDPTAATAQPDPAPADASLLPVREWVQGMPFPEGTDYEAFEPEFVDARVAAPSARVIAFYRHQIEVKWGSFQDLDGELIVTNPNAPIDSLTITADEHGSRLFIKRRTQP